ncbi:hypothetical protein ABT352_33980 [Streptosporangium sp. NPDC000563]|uniref:hypothetical protein n=1 Tax=unclassified Streptosporangium TaxID=2632669 RepID=UPI0033190D4E
MKAFPALTNLLLKATFGRSSMMIGLPVAAITRPFSVVFYLHLPDGVRGYV